MKKSSPRSTGKSVMSDGHDGLLECRMAMLGLDFDETKRDESDMFDEIRRSCLSCGDREACAVDLKRDPNSPVWEAYCPNSSALIALAQAQWLTP